MNQLFGLQHRRTGSEGMAHTPVPSMTTTKIVPSISKHLKDFNNSGEQKVEATVSKMEIVQQKGKGNDVSGCCEIRKDHSTWHK